jgi:predicted transcriptional regulator
MKLIIDDDEVKPIPIKLPMPIVDDDGDLIIEGVIELEKKRGREGTLNQLEKELIAHDAINTSASQTEIARLHGVSQQSVSSLSRGYNTSGLDNRKVNEGVLEVVESARERIANTATQKLLESLETFIPQTLDQKELPGAALKLASVVEKVQQGFNPSEKNGPRFIVFSPRMKAEEAFDIIEVHE